MLLFALLSCHTQKSQIRDEIEVSICNEVEAAHCLLPFPSHHYLRGDSTTNTGYRLMIPEAALPVNVDDVPFNPSGLNKLDGFSLGSSAYTFLDGATLDGVVRWPDLEGIYDQDSKTIFLEQETMTRIPHTVERETLGEEFNQDLLMLRPMVPLNPNMTYIIGIRNLVDDSGNVISAPEGFEKLKNGSPTEMLMSQESQYEDVIFPALTEEGFSRDELQLAWSFHTQSEDKMLQKMTWLRADILDYSNSPIPYSIDEITPSDCDNSRRGALVNGHMTVPLYLDSWDPGSMLMLDEAGLPYRNGTVEVPFLLLLGCSVLEGEDLGTLVQYGHGLLGKRTELDSGYLHKLADDNALILFAADWTGMKLEDSSAITLSIVQDPSGFQTVPDRLHQGWMEFLTLSLLVRQSHFIADSNLQANGEPIIDPSRLFYYGNSQGSVLGGGYAAMHPDMDGVILGVGGAPFSLLLHRAEGFHPFLIVLSTMYDDWKDITLIEAVFQQLWDPTESIGWTQKQSAPVLLHAAIGDAGVPTIGAHLLARAYGAELVTPYARKVFGLNERAPPFYGSAYIEWDYGIEDTDGPYPAPNDTAFDPHNGPRTSPAGMQQIGHFIQSGEIAHFCDGPCDFE